MSCLRSFNIGIIQATTFVAPAANVKTWTSSVGGELYWTMDTDIGTTQSRFNIQGFKNIDLYGVQVLGGIKCQTAATTSHGVVNSWGFQLYCEAQNSLVNGTIQTSPNYWSLNNANANSRILQFTNTNPKIEFADPLKSLKYIDFNTLQAEGFGAETANQIALEWDLNFVFFYKYEGE
jgi:hypothetical protein